eukprot:TRINITY_DN2232_c0_g1_i1.p1 TRINITY_DN2232_c0_g1~~TRINITY_DN2232_c0_g1_i1.p1  ORF type:complete len:497 (+),score=84.04 TRINITY_DN2232_c0_g1_i1:47-1537(+)
MDQNKEIVEFLESCSVFSKDEYKRVPVILQQHIEKLLKYHATINHAELKVQIENKIRELEGYLEEKKKTQDYLPLPFKPPERPAEKQQVYNEGHGAPEIAEHEIMYNPEKDLIGEGSYGAVYKGLCRSKQVAIKVPKEKLPERKLEQFRQEVAILGKIFHPNVVLFMGACTIKTIKIVTERCSTDVEKLLRNKKIPLTLYQRMKMAKGAALGMNWLHGITHITHRDLKTANLLLTEDNTVKVTDFGFGKIFEVGTAFKGRAKGTPLWMAPEVMLGKETNEKRDVYSFGIILWEFVSREEPFKEFKEWQSFREAVAIKGVRPIIPDGTPTSLRYLIVKCWNGNYKQRPGFEEIVFRLNEILVDCIITDFDGNTFWKLHMFYSKPFYDLEERVPWPEFEKMIADVLCWDLSKLPPSQKIELMRPYLCWSDSGAIKDVVTMENFQRCIVWFGPFFNYKHAVDILNTVLINYSLYYLPYVTLIVCQYINSSPIGIPITPA